LAASGLPDVASFAQQSGAEKPRAMLGGVSDARGAVVGGLLVGLLETFAPGYLSSNISALIGSTG
jgi:hypothetical protein